MGLPPGEIGVFMIVESSATKQTYLGLFMVTLATLMYEILLTRIFSITISLTDHLQINSLVLSIPSPFKRY